MASEFVENAAGEMKPFVHAHERHFPASVSFVLCLLFCQRILKMGEPFLVEES